MASKLRLLATARLQQDYLELQTSNAAELPLVAAAPLAILDSRRANDLGAWLHWRVSLMAPPNSRFAGVLLSLDLKFPPGATAHSFKNTLCTAIFAVCVASM